MLLSVITGCVSLIGFIFIGFTLYIEKKLEIISANSDLLTVTADDYTVKLDFIDNEMFNHFYTDPEHRDHIHDEFKGSAVSAFRHYLVNKLPFEMAAYE